MDIISTSSASFTEIHATPWKEPVGAGSCKAGPLPSNYVKNNPKIGERENAKMINRRCEPKAAPSQSQLSSTFTP